MCMEIMRITLTYVKKLECGQSKGGIRCARETPVNCFDDAVHPAFITTRSQHWTGGYTAHCLLNFNRLISMLDCYNHCS